MVEWLDRAADPGRVHTEGRMVRAAVEDGREEVAALLGCRTREVVFTSGGTEAVNAAVWGALGIRDGVIAVPAVEHSSVREASGRAGEVRLLPVDGDGRLRLDALDELLGAGDPVALVHCQWGNHEVGTLQPVADVVERSHRAGALVHVDAVQAAGHVAVDLGALGADLVSVSAHKFGGPPGIGALVVRRGLRVTPFIVGGDQERARRGGMENVPAIAGFAVAARAAAAGGPHEAVAARRHTAALRHAALAVPGVVAFGPVSPQARLPHIVCLGVTGIEAEAVLLALDQAGIAAHSGSACSSESLEPSPVLEAMGVDAQRSLRLSVGWSTEEIDVAAFAATFPAVVGQLRALSRVSPAS